MPSTATSAFLQDLKELPAQNLVTGRLLAMLDDESASAADLGKVIESDPALSAQVMRLANSPFNGLMKQVESAARAVMVLGFTTVRTLAVSAVCNLNGGGGRVSPPGYWLHSVTTAAACAEVARLVRAADPSQAFSAGLLHDLGSVLLFRHDEGSWRRAGAGVPEAARVEAERAVFEVDHAEVGGAVLEGCHFPPGFVLAVTDHHRPFDALESVLGRILVAGEAVADVLAGSGSSSVAADLLDLVGAGSDVDRVGASVEAAVESLSGFLTEG